MSGRASYILILASSVRRAPPFLPACSGICQEWEISEDAAKRELDIFLTSQLQQYDANRGYADARGVSRLSPYLHHGQLSSRYVWRKLQEHQGQVGHGKACKQMRK